MKKYDYFKEETNDIINVITNDDVINAIKNNDKHLCLILDDLLFNNPVITGNENYSYAMNTFKAEEYISHNLDLLADAFNGFNYDRKAVNYALNDPKWCDVLIRLYILPTCIDKAIEIIKHNLNKFEYNLNKKEKKI